MGEARRVPLGVIHTSSLSRRGNIGGSRGTAKLPKVQRWFQLR
jgi:hypothetical protein